MSTTTSAQRSPRRVRQGCKLPWRATTHWMTSSVSPYIEKPSAIQEKAAHDPAYQPGALAARDANANCSGDQFCERRRTLRFCQPYFLGGRSHGLFANMDCPDGGSPDHACRYAFAYGCVV